MQHQNKRSTSNHPEIGDLTVNLINPETGKFDPHYRHFWDRLVKVAIFRNPDTQSIDTLVEVKRNPANDVQAYDRRAVEHSLDALKNWLAADIPPVKNVKLAETIKVMIFRDDDDKLSGAVDVERRQTEPLLLLNNAIKFINLYMGNEPSFDYKKFLDLVEPIVEDALAELYEPGEKMAELSRQRIKNVMVDLAYQIYAQDLGPKPKAN